MSVTFHIEGQGPDYDDPSTYLNLANDNAGELLEGLALPRVLWGVLDATSSRCAADAGSGTSRVITIPRAPSASTDA